MERAIHVRDGARVPLERLVESLASVERVAHVRDGARVPLGRLVERVPSEEQLARVCYTRNVQMGDRDTTALDALASMPARAPRPIDMLYGPYARACGIIAILISIFFPVYEKKIEKKREHAT